MLKFCLPLSMRRTVQTMCCMWLLGQAATGSAGPWLEAGDETTRHHLQVLSDSGLIPQPLTTWPLMWSGINQALRAIEPGQLSEDQLWSYRYVQHELRRARQRVTAGQQISASTGHPGLTDYSTDSRERFESRGYVNYTGDRLAVNLQGAATGDAIDGQRYRLDGSYLAGIWGNWALGVGAIDRWWGPGWQSSIILSNNARPSPGIFFSRVDNEPFQLPLLEWLGPWDLRIFMNRLESNRETPHAKLFGMRATFKPFHQFELGLSRTAQWGGDGRPQDVGTFWDLLLGQDNRGESHIREDSSNEPGNQLGGVDWRLGHRLGSISTAFYGQVVGEDEAGGLPSHVLGMAGLEAAFVWGTTHNRFALEASNTTMEFTKGGTPNVAYEHPLYPSGYRYRGRPLGASTDNDSELITLKGFHSLSNGHQLRWSLASGQINADGSNTARTGGGSVYGEGSDDLWFAQGEYTLPVREKGQLKLGAQYYNNALRIRHESIETAVYLAYTLRL